MLRSMRPTVTEKTLPHTTHSRVIAQIVQPEGEGCSAAGFGRTRGEWLIVTHPGNADQVGSESCEPSVVRIVCSGGFAADVVALEFAMHARACAVGGYPAQHVVHDINRARIDGSCCSVAGDYRLGLHDDQIGRAHV